MENESKEEQMGVIMASALAAVKRKVDEVLDDNVGVFMIVVTKDNQPRLSSSVSPDRILAAIELLAKELKESMPELTKGYEAAKRQMGGSTTH